jgi:hypothetical protein
MDDDPTWDPLGQRERRNRLLISVAVAYAVATLLWRVLDSDFVLDRIVAYALSSTWHASYLLKDRLHIAAVLVVPPSYIVTSILLARRGKRLWLAHRIPPAHLRPTRRSER